LISQKVIAKLKIPGASLRDIVPISHGFTVVIIQFELPA